MAKVHGDAGEVEEAFLVGDGVEEEEDIVLPGFRFHPTDEELVTFYLRRKVAKKPLSIEIIKEMDIYKHDPWDLPKASTVGGEKEWYFFCLRGRKYRNSIRPNRVTGSGFWKATGIDRPIHSAGDCIGLKKSLVYYRGSAGKGTKTDWMMHEFRLPPRAVAGASPSMQEAEVWTICRIFKRNVAYRRQPPAASKAALPQQDSSSNTAGSLESDTGDEHMNSGLPPYSHGGHHQMNVAGGYHYYQQFQGQWDTTAPAQAPPPQAVSTTAASHQSVLSPVAADLYRDGYWEELGRIVMELNDPSTFYDCRYA